MVVSLITVDQCDMGIRSISAYLKEHNVNTRLIFFNSENKRYDDHLINKLINKIKDSDLIGISFRYISISRAIQLYEALKRMGIPVIVGGSAAISAPQICIKHFDMVCATEGEEVMLEFHNRLINKKNIYALKGVYYKRSNKIIQNRRSTIKETKLNFDYMCTDDYMLINEKEFKKIDKPPLFYDNYGVFVKNSIFIMSVRGCIFNCSYCINSILKKYFPYRKTSINNLIDQLKEIKRRYPNLEYVYLFDDDFFSRPKADIESFSNLYKKHVNLPFWAYCSPKTLSEDKLKLMVQAGLTNLNMGIQSGSDYINKKIYNRQITKQQILNATKIIKKYLSKMDVPIYDLMMNNPFEKRRDVLDTINLLSNIPRPFYIDCHSLILFPGTNLYNKLKSHNNPKKFLSTSFYKNYHDFCQINTKSRNLYLDSVLLWTEGLWSNKYSGMIHNKLLPFFIKNKTINILSRFPKTVLLINRIFHKIRHLYENLIKTLIPKKNHNFKYA